MFRQGAEPLSGSRRGRSRRRARTVDRLPRSQES